MADELCPHVRWLTKGPEEKLYCARCKLRLDLVPAGALDYAIKALDLIAQTDHEDMNAGYTAYYESTEALKHLRDLLRSSVLK